MPTYTKEQLQELLDALKDGESFKTFDTDEVNSIVQSRIAEMTEKKLKPIEERLANLTTERDQAFAKLQAIQAEADKKNKTSEELLTAELTKKDSEIEAWRKKHAESDAAIQVLAKQRRTEFKSNRLLALFSAEGDTKAANPARAVREALALAGGVLELEENGEGMHLRALDDPQLKNPIPLEDWGKAFLDANPDLKAATGSGAPVSPTKPKGETNVDPMEGKTVGERMKIATREKYVHKT
jgi:hypothetical protein